MRNMASTNAGYAPREVTSTPSSITGPILAGQVFAWNPSIRGAKSEDTILVCQGCNEILTETGEWACFEIGVGEQAVRRPAILE
jgi:Xaa-Pro dipeptidase